MVSLICRSIVVTNLVQCVVPLLIRSHACVVTYKMLPSACVSLSSCMDIQHTRYVLIMPAERDVHAEDKPKDKKESAGPVRESVG
jgi:hypothetical protein